MRTLNSQSATRGWRLSRRFRLTAYSHLHCLVQIKLKKLVDCTEHAGIRTCWWRLTTPTFNLSHSSLFPSLAVFQRGGSLSSQLRERCEYLTHPSVPLWCFGFSTSRFAPFLVPFQDLNCFLVDNNGFILLSKDRKEVVVSMATHTKKKRRLLAYLLKAAQQYQHEKKIIWPLRHLLTSSDGRWSLSPAAQLEFNYTVKFHLCDLDIGGSKPHGISRWNFYDLRFFVSVCDSYLI